MISAEDIKALMAKDGEWKFPEERVQFKQALLTLQTLLNQAAEVLTVCDEAMVYMSEYDIPLCLSDNVKQALAAIQPYLTKEQSNDR